MLATLVAWLREARERAGVSYWRYVAAQRTIEGLRKSYEDAEVRNRQLQEELTRYRHAEHQPPPSGPVTYEPDTWGVGGFWKRTSRKDSHAGKGSNGQGDDRRDRPWWRSHHRSGRGR